MPADLHLVRHPPLALAWSRNGLSREVRGGGRPCFGASVIQLAADCSFESQPPAFAGGGHPHFYPPGGHSPRLACTVLTVPLPAGHHEVGALPRQPGSTDCHCSCLALQLLGLPTTVLDGTGSIGRRRSGTHLGEAIYRLLCRNIAFTKLFTCRHHPCRSS